MAKSTQTKLAEQSAALEEVRKKIEERTDGTFLWVSLVFRELRNCNPRNMLARLKELPSDLIWQFPCPMDVFPRLGIVNNSTKTHITDRHQPIRRDAVVVGI